MAEEREFLRRWSERKAEARKGVPVDEVDEPSPLTPVRSEPAAGPVAEPDTGGDGEAEPGELDIPEELKSIDIDALGYDDDFTVFMKPGVPDALRKKALRRLWRTNPVLANLDGLNDYEEDFTDAAVAVKGLQSAYRIGKGFITAAELQAQEAEAADAAFENGDHEAGDGTGGGAEPDTTAGDDAGKVAEAGDAAAPDQSPAAGEAGDAARSEVAGASVDGADGDDETAGNSAAAPTPDRTA